MLAFEILNCILNLEKKKSTEEELHCGQLHLSCIYEDIYGFSNCCVYVDLCFYLMYIYIKLDKIWNASKKTLFIHVVYIVGPSERVAKHNHNDNNWEFMECFQTLKVFYSHRKTCSVQIPPYKSMVYQQCVT